MHQFRVELRVGDGSIKVVDIMASTHEQAAARAERQTGLLVLSTEYIG